MRFARPWMLAAWTVACTGAATVEPTPVPEHPDTPTLTAAELGTGGEKVTLVPSPVETQKALERAGIETQLSALVEDHSLDVRNENPDNAAVRTGVVIADMLLTVKTSDKAALLGQLASVQIGMEQLDGGADILRTIDDLEDRVRGDAVTRDELLKELDELSGALIPELEFNGQDRVVPLIQAGSWLEGANLLAKAVKAAGKPDAADGLLKQPAVVDYFLTYVKSEGQARAPEAVTEKLEASLTTLKGIADKPASLTAEDIDVVIKTTDDVLALL